MAVIFIFAAMKIFISLICALFAFASCHKVDKQLKEKISNSDSVAINYFAGDGKVDSVTSVKIIHSKDTIEQLTDFITASLINIKSNCGYDGSIHFYKNDNVVQDINFRMNDENCRQFSFVEDGNFTATGLSSHAKQLLEEIKK